MGYKISCVFLSKVWMVQWLGKVEKHFHVPLVQLTDWDWSFHQGLCVAWRAVRSRGNAWYKLDEGRQHTTTPPTSWAAVASEYWALHLCFCFHVSAGRADTLGTFRLIRLKVDEDLRAAVVLASLDCCRTFVWQNFFYVFIRQQGCESKFPFVGLCTWGHSGVR